MIWQCGVSAVGSAAPFSTGGSDGAGGSRDRSAPGVSTLAVTAAIIQKENRIRDDDDTAGNLRRMDEHH